MGVHFKIKVKLLVFLTIFYQFQCIAMDNQVDETFIEDMKQLIEYTKSNVMKVDDDVMKLKYIDIKEQSSIAISLAVETILNKTYFTDELINCIGEVVEDFDWILNLPINSELPNVESLDEMHERILLEHKTTKELFLFTLDVALTDTEMLPRQLIQTESTSKIYETIVSNLEMIKNINGALPMYKKEIMDEYFIYNSIIEDIITENSQELTKKLQKCLKT